MTGGTVPPRATTTASGLANAAGWEMRYVAGTSDKYYRVILAGNLVIVNWGRHGQPGEQKVHRHPTPAEAKAKAQTLTEDKDGKGYWLSRDVTGFLAAVAAVHGSSSGTEPENRAARDIIAGFTAASTEGRPPVAGSLSSHVAAALDHVSWTGPVPAAAPAPAPAAAASPRASHRRSGTVTLTPAGEQTRPNGQVYKPRDLGGYEDVAFLRKARERREFVLLAGPPGTGKTALAEAAHAGRDGSGMVTIACTGDTAETNFVGTFVQNPDGTYRWAPGPLHLSVVADIPLFVDEIALPDPGVLAVLYALLDGRGVLRIPMNPALDPIPVGPGWGVIAACNPDAPGANMSEALLSRFSHHIQVDSDWGLAADLGAPAGLITIAKNLDGKRRDGLVTWSPQLREVLDFASQAAEYGTGYAAANFASKAPAGPDRDALIAALHAHYPRTKALSLGGRYGR